jgi:hypothetical protein
LGLCAVLVLAVAVGAVAGISRVRGVDAVGSAISAADPSASATPGPPAQALPVTPTVLPPVAPLTPRSLPTSAAPSVALSTAARWTAAWVNHPQGTTAQQWVAALKPYTTDEYLGVLTGVDPSNVPASKVTGEPKAVRVAARSVQVRVPTDAFPLVVLVVDTDDGWRVAGYDRA